jgi:hypothetical protein
MPIASFGGDFKIVSATATGARIIKVSGSSTDVDVQFSRYIYDTTNWGSSEKWRVVKAKAGAAVGFGAATATSSGLLQPPTSIEDVKATQMGLKSYAHGTTYNGGNAPTIALSSGGGTLTSVDYSAFIPYQMQNGTWRLKGSFTTTMSSTARTEAVFTVNGITMTATQAIDGSPSPGAAVQRMRAYSTNNFAIAHVSVSSTSYYISFDVELTAKPTWAY